MCRMTTTTDGSVDVQRVYERANRHLSSHSSIKRTLAEVLHLSTDARQLLAHSVHLAQFEGPCAAGPIPSACYPSYTSCQGNVLGADHGSARHHNLRRGGFHA
jgi:hypothetical protein